MGVGRQRNTGQRHLGQLGHVEHVRGAAEQTAGVDRVALVPDVLHVVRLVLDERADRRGVEHLAVRRRRLVGIDDGEEVRRRRVIDGVLVRRLHGIQRKVRSLDVRTCRVGDVLVAGPDEEVLVVAGRAGRGRRGGSPGRSLLRQVIGHPVVLAVAPLDRRTDDLHGRTGLVVGAGDDEYAERQDQCKPERQMPSPLLHDSLCHQQASLRRDICRAVVVSRDESSDTRVSRSSYRAL